MYLRLTKKMLPIVKRKKKGLEATETDEVRNDDKKFLIISVVDYFNSPEKSVDSFSE